MSAHCCLVAEPCSTLCDPMDCILPGSSGPWDFQIPQSMGFPRQHTGVSCHFLLQGNFLTQGSNPGLLHWQVDSLPLSQLLHSNLGPPDLSPEKPGCGSRSNRTLHRTAYWYTIGKGVRQPVYCHHVCVTSMQSTSAKCWAR